MRKFFTAAGLLFCMNGSTQAANDLNLPVLGDPLSGIVSTQEEYEFGRELLRSIRRETPMLDDPLMEEYIASITYRLAANSELTDYRLDFVLINSTALNAFAAPGGIIGINAGLFLYAETEGEFASVLAHELAHLSQRHYARSLQQAQNNAVPNLAAMLASLVIMATVGGDAGQAALMTTQAANMENQLRFSRKNEEEADRVGIRTLYNSGFNPNDMPEMFEHMLRRKNSASRLPEFLSTHPLDESRVADTRNRAANYPAVDAVENIEFLLMRQRVLSHYEEAPDKLIVKLEAELPQLRGAARDAALYGIAQARLKAGNHVGALENIGPLLRKEPNRITYVILEAEINQALGKHQRALDILEQHLRINPNNHPLTMSYASALVESGRIGDAERILKKQSSIRPNDINLWYELAEIHGLAGNISEVHQARAEYFLLTGELGRARDQLSFALNLEKDSLAVARIRQRLEDIRQLENKFYRRR